MAAPRLCGRYDIAIRANGRTVTFDESESTSDAAIDLGGGVNIGLTGSMRLRVAASYFRVLEEDSGNGVRFAVGIVFPF